MYLTIYSFNCTLGSWTVRHGVRRAGGRYIRCLRCPHVTWGMLSRPRRTLCASCACRLMRFAHIRNGYHSVQTARTTRINLQLIF